ncbi:MAG: SDR family NAD(P)-dependent oxidoreductase [Bacteroidia bacterium]|nr:SDR family NAD(P)-dependent oxidoreductase [Bacteroidia bacterium]
MIVVITGAASGIGLELVKIYLSEGHQVIGVDKNLKNQDSQHFEIYQTDLSLKENVDSLFHYIKEKYAKIDIFIANAGFAYYERINEASWDHMKNIYDINVFSSIYSYEKMMEISNGQPFKFVVISSVMAFWPLPGYSLYSSSKAALMCFFESMKYERSEQQSTHIVFPVSTKTNFFKVSGQTHAPWLQQNPQHVAKRIFQGVNKNKRKIYPSRLFQWTHAICPCFLSFYINRERKILMKQA